MIEERDTLEGRLVRVGRAVRHRKKVKTQQIGKKEFRFFQAIFLSEEDKEEGGAEEEVVVSREEEVEKAIGELREHLSRLEEVTEEEMMEDILRVMAMQMELLLSPSSSLELADEYLTKAMLRSSCSFGLKGYLYMALVMTSRVHKPLEESFFDVVFEDIDAGNLHALRWVASTTFSISPFFAEKLMSSLVNLLLKSPTGSVVREKAAVGVLHLSRYHGTSLPESDESRRFSRLLREDGSSPSLINSLLVMARDSTDSSFLAPVKIAPSVAMCLEKSFSDFSLATERCQKHNAVRTGVNCLRFFGNYLFRKEIHGQDISSEPWWTSVGMTIASILKQDVLLEKDVFRQESTALDDERHWHRSASLLASYQVSAVEALACIYSNDLLNHELLPEKKAAQNGGVIFGSLLGLAKECVLRLLFHADDHVKYAGALSLRSFSSCLVHTCDNKLLKSRPPIQTFQQALSREMDLIVEELLEVITEKSHFEDMATLRIVFDVLVKFSNTDAAAIIQSEILTELRRGDDSAEDEDLQRYEEYARCLMKFNDRNYVQSLQMIANARLPAYNSAVRGASGVDSGPSPTDWAVWQRYVPGNGDALRMDRLPSALELSKAQAQAFPHSALGEEESPLGVRQPSQHLVSRRSPARIALRAESKASISRSMSSPFTRSLSGPGSAEADSPSKSKQSKQMQSLRSISRSLSSSFEDTPSSSSPRVSKEVISITISEHFSGTWNSDGTLRDDSVDLSGTVFMTSRVNAAVPVAIGVNLRHPNVFSSAGQRLERSETLEAYAVTTGSGPVLQVDPRGAVTALASPISSERVEVLHFKARCSGESCPLKLVSSVSCDSEGEGCVLELRQEFRNVSGALNLLDLSVEIVLPSYVQVDKCESVKGNGARFVLAEDKQGGVATLPKLKHGKQSALLVKLHLVSSDVSRFGRLDDRLRESDEALISSSEIQNAKVSFKVVPSKKSNSPQNVSLLSGFNLRYVHVPNQVVSVRKVVKFEPCLGRMEASFQPNEGDRVKLRSLKSFSSEIKSLKSFSSELKSLKSSSQEMRSSSPDLSASPMRDVEEERSDDEWSTPATDLKLSERPWQWEADSKLLEDLYDEHIDGDLLLPHRSNVLFEKLLSGTFMNEFKEIDSFDASP